MGKPTMWLPNRSDTNRAVQAEKQAGSLKFGRKVEEELYYPSSENKGADQLPGYREADLRLCFRLCSCWFSHGAAHFFPFAAVAIGHQLHVLWTNRFQLSVQSDLHVPVLSDVGGGLVQGETSRFLLHVHVWRNDNDCILNPYMMNGYSHHYQLDMSPLSLE